MYKAQTNIFYYWVFTIPTIPLIWVFKPSRDWFFIWSWKVNLLILNVFCQNNRIRGLLEKCTLDHEARIETLHIQMRERALSDARWSQMQQNLNPSVSANILGDYFTSICNWWPDARQQLLYILFYYQQSDVSNDIPLQVDSQAIELTGEEVDTLRGKYIRRLTAVLIHHIPAFWKVALSVFSGKFAKVDWMLSFFLDFGASHYFARVTFKLWFKKYAFLGHMVHYIYACPFLLQWIWGASFQFSSA